MSQYCFFLQFFRPIFRRLELATVQTRQFTNPWEPQKAALSIQQTHGCWRQPTRQVQDQKVRSHVCVSSRNALSWDPPHIFSVGCSDLWNAKQDSPAGSGWYEVMWDTSERKSLWESHSQFNRKVKCRGILTWLTASGCCRVVGDTALHAESPGFGYWSGDRKLWRDFSWFYSVHLKRLRILLEIRKCPFPSISFQIHYLPFIMFKTIWPELSKRL